MSNCRVVRVDVDGEPSYYKLQFRPCWPLPWFDGIYTYKTKEEVMWSYNYIYPEKKPKPKTTVIYPVKDYYV